MQLTILVLQIVAITSCDEKTDAYFLRDRKN